MPGDAMRVAAVQFKPPKGDAVRARGRLAELARRASEGADLVVLPEMAVTGYVFADGDSVRPLCEDPEGPTFQALSLVARESSTWIVGGFPERAGASLYNSAWIIDPHGQLEAVYRKTLLFDTDLSWATAGDSGYFRIETERGAFGVGICMDLNDDRFIDWCAGADLTTVVLPTNWVHEDHATFDVWDYWAWRIESIGAALVAANTYGPEEHLVFCGRSVIMRDWRVLASAPAVGDAIVRAELERSRPPTR